MRRHQGQPDVMLMLYFGILLLFGLVMLTSASSPVGYDRFNDAYFFIKRQLVFGALPGLVLFIALAKCPYKLLPKIGYAAFLLSVILLILVFVPGVGSTLDTNASSWIKVAGFSFQPSEFAKLGLVLFLAHVLSKMGRRIGDLKQGFLPALGVGIMPVLLVALEPDVGTATVLFAILFGMLFFAGARFIHLGGIAGLAVVAFVILVTIAPYRAARLTTFLHPELDPQGIGYHINQAFVAIGSGGWLGQGLGHSKQKFQYLPEVHADSIFAVIGEEMGFVATTGFTILLFVLLGRRMLTIADKAPDGFGRLAVCGVVVWFMAQSFFNIGAMVGIMPLTGIPLPFVSHGGTALLLALAAAGVVVNVSKQTR